MVYTLADGTQMTRRKRITVTGSVQTDFQIKMSAIAHAAAMQPDFSDCRFVKADMQTLIDAWLESKSDGSSADVWAEFPTTPGDHWMYYGNAGAANCWDIDATFLFGDDFNEDNTNVFEIVNTIQIHTGLLPHGAGAVQGVEYYNGYWYLLTEEATPTEKTYLYKCTEAQLSDLDTAEYCVELYTGSSADLCCHDGYCYCMRDESGQTTIYKRNASDLTAVTTYSLSPADWEEGIAWDGTNWWTTSWETSGSTTLTKRDSAFAAITTYSIGRYSIQGLDFRNGELWFSDYQNNEVCRFNIVAETVHDCFTNTQITHEIEGMTWESDTEMSYIRYDSNSYNYLMKTEKRTSMWDTSGLGWSVTAGELLMPDMARFVGKTMVSRPHIVRMRVKELVTGESQNMYGFADDTSAYDLGNKIYIKKYTGNNYFLNHVISGSRSHNAGSAAGNLPYNTYYVHEIVWLDGVSHWYVDGVLKLSFTSATPTADMSALIYNYDNADLNVDWILIRKYASDPPAYELGGEEHQRRTPQFM